MASSVRHSECTLSGTFSALHTSSVYEGGMLLFVTIIVKRDHLEVPESRRQVPDGGDPHAHLVTPNPITRVVKAGVQKFLDLHR